MTATTSSSGVMPGADSVTHAGTSDVGVLLLHGFTGTPVSLQTPTARLIAGGHHVEVPRLPGHGTTIEDMMSTGWPDWSEAALDAHDRLAERVEQVVVVGLSMGGALALFTALLRPAVPGVVCVNPATRPVPAEVMAVVDGMIASGQDVVPGDGSDIADPDVVEPAYGATPLPPLRSFVEEGLRPMADRYGELEMPLRLFTSRQDHVVDPGDSVHLAATYGGPVEHTWLERSFHVATRDWDRDLIADETAAFVARVAGG